MQTTAFADIPTFTHLAEEAFAEVRSYEAKASPKRRALPHTEKLMLAIEKSLDYALKLSEPGTLRGKKIEDQFELAMIGSRLIAKITPAFVLIRDGVVASDIPVSRKVEMLNAVARQEKKATTTLSALLDIAEICFNAARFAQFLDFSDITPEELQAMASTVCADSLNDPDEDAAWANL